MLEPLLLEPWRACAGFWVSSSVMERSCDREGRSRKGCAAIGGAGRPQGQGANHDPPRQFDLEAVVSGGFRFGERRLRRAAKHLDTGLAALQRLLGGVSPPWFGRDAAQRQPRFQDLALFD